MGRGFDPLLRHQPSLARSAGFGSASQLAEQEGADEPNPEGKAAATKHGVRSRANHKRMSRSMTGFYYVYMLSDVATRTHHYVGITADLKQRLEHHNAGQVLHTSKFRPWQIDAAVAVRSKSVAAELEKYFKSGSGRAFANRHLFIGGPR